VPRGVHVRERVAGEVAAAATVVEVAPEDVVCPVTRCSPLDDKVAAEDLGVGDGAAGLMTVLAINLYEMKSRDN
jgi:hypothetical protein